MPYQSAFSSRPSEYKSAFDEGNQPSSFGYQSAFKDIQEKPKGSGLLDVIKGGFKSVMGAAEKYAPQTVQAVKDTGQTEPPIKSMLGLVEAPYTLFKGVPGAVATAEVDEWKNVGDYFSTVFDKNQTVSAKASKAINVATGAANLVFSPLSAIFSGANDVPGLGRLTKIITAGLGDTSNMAVNYANKDIATLTAPDGVTRDYLHPLTQEDADNLKGSIDSLTSLATQIYVGGVAGEAAGSIHPIVADLVKKEADPKIKQGLESVPATTVDELVSKRGEVETKTILEQAAEKARNTPPDLPQTLFLSERSVVPATEGAGFTMKEAVDTDKLAKSKLLQDYQTKLANFNKKPTVAKKEAMLKAKDALDMAAASTEAITEPLFGKPLPRPSPEPPAPTLFKTDIPKKIEEAPKPIEPIAKPAEGSQIAGVAKSINAKAIEQGLIAKGFDELAEFKGTTFKEQAAEVEKIVSEDNATLDKTRAIIRGEEPLPSNVKGVALISAIEDMVGKNPENPANTDIMYELANSPLLTKLSEGASELSIARMRTKDSAMDILDEIRKNIEQEAKQRLKTKDISKAKKQVSEKLKDSTDVKKVAPKEELKWDNFLSKFNCK
jgi:hypothetical protein